MAKERRNFRHELAPILDATGVYLLNLKLPTWQVTHVLQVVTAEHRKQGGIPGKKWQEQGRMEAGTPTGW